MGAECGRFVALSRHARPRTVFLREGGGRSTTQGKLKPRFSFGIRFALFLMCGYMLSLSFSYSLPPSLPSPFFLPPSSLSSPFLSHLSLSSCKHYRNRYRNNTCYVWHKHQSIVYHDHIITPNPVLFNLQGEARETLHIKATGISG